MVVTRSPTSSRLATLLAPTAGNLASKGKTLSPRQESGRTANLLARQKRKEQEAPRNLLRTLIPLEKTYLDDILTSQGIYLIQNNAVYACGGVRREGQCTLAYNGTPLSFVEAGDCRHYESIMRATLAPLKETHRRKILADIEKKGESLIENLDAIASESDEITFLPQYLMENVLQLKDAVEKRDARRQETALKLSSDLRKIITQNHELREIQERVSPLYEAFITKTYPATPTCLFLLGNVYGLSRRPEKGEELETLIANASFIHPLATFTNAFTKAVQEIITEEVYALTEEQIDALSRTKNQVSRLRRTKPVHESSELGSWGYQKVHDASYIVYKKISPFILKRDDDHAFYSKVKVGVVVSQGAQTLKLATESFIHDPRKEDTFEHPFRLGSVTHKGMHMGPKLCDGGNKRTVAGLLTVHHDAISFNNLQEGKLPAMIEEEILLTERKLKYGFKRGYDSHRITKDYNNYISKARAEELVRKGVELCDNPSS